MIENITLENFKSFQKATLPLAPLTLLIGANAAGKSNAIEALRILSWLADGKRLTAIQSSVQQSDQVVRGRVQDLGYCQEKTFTLSYTSLCNSLAYTLKLSLELGKDETLHIIQESMKEFFSISSPPLYEVKQAANGGGNDLQVAYNNFAKGGIKPNILCSDQFAIFTQLDSGSRFQSKHKESIKRIPPIARRFVESLKNVLFLDPHPSLMRGYSFKSEKKLEGDGKNLSSVLFHLCGGGKERRDEHKENYRHILEFIRSLPEQDIQDLDFLIGPRDEVMIQLVETFGPKKQIYDASLLSDGTLRVLAVAAALLSSPKNATVVIEEIDNGVHPSRAKQLLEKISELANERGLRVLLSSHNPALLDALPDEAIPHVVFCYRDKQNGSSRLVQLQNIPDYPELIVQGGVGHLMTTGILERFVKNHPGPKERQEKAKVWLEQLQEATGEIHP